MVKQKVFFKYLYFLIRWLVSIKKLLGLNTSIKIYGLNLTNKINGALCIKFGGNKMNL